MDLILLANHFYFQFLLACDVAEAVSKGVFNKGLKKIEGHQSIQEILLAEYLSG